MSRRGEHAVADQLFGVGFGLRGVALVVQPPHVDLAPVHPALGVDPVEIDPDAFRHRGAIGVLAIEQRDALPDQNLAFAHADFSGEGAARDERHHGAHQPPTPASNTQSHHFLQKKRLRQESATLRVRSPRPRKHSTRQGPGRHIHAIGIIFA